MSKKQIAMIVIALLVVVVGYLAYSKWEDRRNLEEEAKGMIEKEYDELSNFKKSNTEVTPNNN